ncbi:hypothetical protein IEO21_08417 [Rhodonia placenta]|uniref:Uncharacterized protein n=1 Tax=Rhodonia placenta TaxID=104341 RepID=A0A8H7NWP0_9APHY|nr:hypothetical protein IEO21_08417 [Postia placenta]
MDEPVTTSRL